MKRRLLLLFVLFSTAFWAMAERIDVATARRIAENVAASNTGGLRSASELSLIYAAAPGQEKNALRSTGTVDGATDYFVFNIGANKGFVIVSGDDRVRPVLGYSDEGNIDFDNLPDNLRAHLAYFQSQISWVENKAVNQSPEIALEWSRYLSGTTLRSGNEKVIETANWGQYAPYNAMCPLINGKRAVTGCGATATAIIMRYHQWPLQAQNGVSSHPLMSKHMEWQCESLDYSSGYNWSNEAMPLNVMNNSNTPEIAKLMWHVGANVKMLYTDKESYSYLEDIVSALQNVFDYSLAVRALQREYYSDSEWENMLIKEINEDRPVIYRGGNIDNTIGHIFVCDGYNSNHFFRINWGWNNQYNGYFTLSALGNKNTGEYFYGHWMIVGAKKDDGEQPIYELHYSAEPMCSVTPLPLNTPFNVQFYLYNSGSGTDCFYLNAAIYDLETGTLGNPLLKKSNSTSDLKPNWGWWQGTPFTLSNISLPIGLKSSERLVVIYSRQGNDSWEILKGASDKYYAFDMNGLASMEIEGENRYNVNIDNSQNITVVEGEMSNILEGSNWSMTIKAEDGYQLPMEIEVEMGNRILTKNDYEYDYNTGIINIKSVTGNIIITAEAVKIHTVTTVFSGVSATTEVPQTVLNGKELTFTLQALKGYKLPETITVRMDEEYAPETDYTYEQSTGVFSITKVTGNVSVAVVADRYYTVSNTIKNLTVTPEIPTEMKAGGTITFTLQAETGYKLPKAITVTMDGNLLTVENDYTYDVSTGEVSITPVQGDIQITATGEAVAYYKIDVTTNINHLKVKGDVPEQVEEGGSVSFTLTPDENYKLPTAVTVTMGDKSADFTYDAGSGQVSITNIQGDIVVAAIGIDNSQQEVIILSEEGLIVEPITPVKTGEKVELTLKVQKGYTLPETIVVTMGGNNLEAGTEYTYDVTTGKFTLQSITGELRIKVVPVKIKYDVTAALTHLTASIAEKVAYNDPLSFMLVPEKGYKLSATITVEMGASTLQVGDDYSYNTTTGEVKIKPVTDVVKIKAVGVELSKYTITMALKNLKSDKKELTVYEGESFTFKLIPDAGYRLPETIAVTGADGAITDVVYNSTSGEVKIPKVEEALTVTAVAKAIPTYAVEFQLTDVTTDWKEDAVVQEEGTLRCTLKAKTGFLLPTSITVTMGGVAYKDYTYDAKTGKVEVRNVTGKVVIVAVGLDDSKRKVALSLSHVSSKPSPTEVPVNSQLELVFTADNGYKLPETIKVSMGNKTLTAGSDYTYNKSTGKFTLAKVTGDVEIIVIAELIQTPTPDPDPKPVTYTVTLPVIEGVVLTSETGTAIKENENFIFTITLKEGYKNSKPVVKANGKEILPDSKGRYVVKNVKTNITITVSGIVKDGPTANLEIQGSLKVWGADGHLHILSSKVGEARVITYSGQLYKIITLTGGETITPLPSGIYIVRIDGQSYKVYLY